MNDESNNNILPETRSADQIRWDTLRQYLLDPRENYPEPYTMLEFNGVPFAKVGGLAAISGQKKNGKSFVLTQLMAAILNDGNDRTNQYLPGLKVPERTIEYLGHKPKVLYVDTEMEKLSSAKVLRRVHWLCDVDMSQPFPDDRFSVLWLKSMPKDDMAKPYKRRYELIRMAIDAIQPDVVFIDGLRDLLASINDEESGTTILDELGTLAEERRMNIWLALHQNPGKAADSDEAKMRGWIGTELGNKVSDTLISIKSKKPEGVTFTVKQQDARDKDMDDWTFEITEDAGQLGVPRIITKGTNLNSKSKEQPTCDDVKLIREWIEQAKDQYEWPMSRSQIKKTVFGEIGGQKNDGKQQADLMAAINMGYLEESTMKIGGYYMLQPPEDLPF
jgi:archaellum biogenesis ATPase FlaH